MNIEKVNSFEAIQNNFKCNLLNWIIINCFGQSVLCKDERFTNTKSAYFKSKYYRGKFYFITFLQIGEDN